LNFRHGPLEPIQSAFFSDLFMFIVKNVCPPPLRSHAINKGPILSNLVKCVLLVGKFTLINFNLFLFIFILIHFNLF